MQAGALKKELELVIAEWPVGDQPLCTFAGPEDDAAASCQLHRAKDHKQSFCEGEADKTCARYQAFKKLDDQANKQFEADRKHSQERVNSLVFNTFIFLQVTPLGSAIDMDEITCFAQFFVNMAGLHQCVHE